MFDYVPALFGLIMHAFKDCKKNGGDSIRLVIDILDNYEISLEMFKEHLLQLQFDPQKTDLYKQIDSQLKSKLTKEYNQKHKNSFKRGKKKAVGSDTDDADTDDADDLVISG